MAEKLNLSKEALQEAADLLSQLANPNGIKNPVPRPIPRLEPKAEKPAETFQQYSGNLNEPDQNSGHLVQQPINVNPVQDDKPAEFWSNFSQEEQPAFVENNIPSQQIKQEEPAQNLQHVQEQPRIENFEKKEINDNVRRDLLESVTMKPKPVTKGDPNVLINQDQKKIEDLARSIFGGDGVRTRK